MLIDRKISLACRLVKKTSMIENFDVFDFKLSEEDIEKIKEIDQGKSPFMDSTDSEESIELNEEIV